MKKPSAHKARFLLNSIQIIEEMRQEHTRLYFLLNSIQILIKTNAQHTYFQFLIGIDSTPNYNDQLLHLFE